MTSDETLSDFFKRRTLTDIQETVEVTPPPSLPKQIGPYPIESMLNKGGMSLLYLGINPETHEPLAIKVLSPQFLSHPEMVNRFFKEAEIIQLADHPNIVKLYGQGEWEKGLYIAMEFIRGISLRQLILQNSLTLKRSLELVIQIGYALFHLHSHEVIHRDLKPENILLTESGGIKVIDFGIAQLHTETLKEQTTNRRRVIGTPVYMSPEQKEDPLKVSYASDIYSLGIITYELVLGKLSHGVIHLSLMPRGLQKILSKALQPKPEDRYQDVMDFISDISSYTKSENFEKELRGSDYTSELFEELKESQLLLLLPQALPNWQRIDLGVVHTHALGLLPIYYDFFDLEDGFGIILAEPLSKGASGLLHIALLKGMIAANRHLMLHPTKLATTLNNLLLSENIEQAFTINILLLLPNRNLLRYLSCGFGPLWDIPGSLSKPQRIEAENIALGITSNVEFIEVSTNWTIGDRLILHTFKSPKAKEGVTDETLQKALSETLYLSPQKQAEALLRKVFQSHDLAIEERPITVMSLHRKS